MSIVPVGASMGQSLVLGQTRLPVLDALIAEIFSYYAGILAVPGD